MNLELIAEKSSWAPTKPKYLQLAELITSEIEKGALQLNQQLPWLEASSQQDKDIERFRFFSSGFIAQDPDRPNRIIDIRYAFVPNDIQALWSIEVSPSARANAHVRYLTHRNEARHNLSRLWQLVIDQ